MAKKLSQPATSIPFLIVSVCTLFIILIVIVYAIGQRTSIQSRAAPSCEDKCTKICRGKEKEEKCKTACTNDICKTPKTPAQRREKCISDCRQDQNCIRRCDEAFPPSPTPKPKPPGAGQPTSEGASGASGSTGASIEKDE